jgi:DHA2 family multidrug resistance protein
LLFVPINVAAFSNLRGAEIAQGAGLMSLSRQLGGSFGIAILASFITHQMAANRGDLVDNVYAGNPALTQRTQLLTGGLKARAGYSDRRAGMAAYSIVDRQLMGQAATLSYNSGFALIGFVMLGTAPCVFILRRRKAAAPSQAK